MEQDIDTTTHGEMAVMGRDGDTKLIWSRDNADEVDNARRTFRDLKAKGYACFRTRGKNGDRGEQVTEFDPNAERYIFIPAMAGG